MKKYQTYLSRSTQRIKNLAEDEVETGNSHGMSPQNPKQKPSSEPATADGTAIANSSEADRITPDAFIVDQKSTHGHE